MPQQQELFKPPTANASQPSTVQGVQAELQAQPAEPKPRRLHPAVFFLLVAVRMNIGLWVAILPWTRFWDANPLILMNSTVANLASHGEIRGLLTGLGLLNIWIAFRDALHADYQF